ncbi:hypothetical protein SpCBS45565_g05036 [Spizellomyces sp. 'palustris']|nr:hypothetical protein SpCBS45565_g05036 [Spizellomyces sp. 'palustris']
MDVQGLPSNLLEGTPGRNKRRRTHDPPMRDSITGPTKKSRQLESANDISHSPETEAALQQLVEAAQNAKDNRSDSDQPPATTFLLDSDIAALPDTPDGLGTLSEGEEVSAVPGQPLPPPSSMASFVQSSLHWVYNISTPENFDSNGQPRNRRKRRRTTDEEQAALEAAYRLDPQMPPAEREKLARTLNMPSKSVQIWFQNRRQTAKKNRDGTWNGIGKWQRTPYKVVGNYKVVGPEHVATPTTTKSSDPIDHAGVVDAVHALIGLSQGSSQEEPKSAFSDSDESSKTPGMEDDSESGEGNDDAQTTERLKEEPQQETTPDTKASSQSPPLLTSDPTPQIPKQPTKPFAEPASISESLCNPPDVMVTQRHKPHEHVQDPEAVTLGHEIDLMDLPTRLTSSTSQIDLLDLPLPARLTSSASQMLSSSQASEFFNFSGYAADIEAEMMASNVDGVGE